MKTYSGKGGTHAPGELVSGVTGLNYGQKGAAFVVANPDKATVIVRQNSAKTDEAGNRYEVSAGGLRQWGAWRAYLKAKGFNTALMERRDYWTVPAPWPHMFDAEASIAADYVAGDTYLDARRAERNRQFDRSDDLRKLVVANKLGYDPHRRRSTYAPPVDAPKAPESPADLKSEAKPASDELRARMGLGPRPKAAKPSPDEGFVEGFDIP